MARISGRLLTLDVDGTDYADQVSKAVITSGESDSDFVTFADAAAGGSRQYALELTMAQDLAAGALLREVIDNVGDTVPFTMAPYGNAVASASQPHIEGNAVISEPDGDFVGGEADMSTTAVMTTEVSWSLTAKFALVTA
jgi:hypothetical protein